LNGKEAEMLARSRIEIGDLGRINNQTVILKGIAAKMLTPSGIAAIPDLVNQLKRNVLTDLNPDQISQLVCLAGKIDFQKDVIFETLPEALMDQTMVLDPTRGVNTSVLVGNNPEIRDLMTDFQAGIWP
jgi:anionic cell wall polymer biosynthesis LytR-Cps2A-Psr (LCP) family protein